MGEMADEAIDRAGREVEHFEKHRDSSQATQYDEGLIDESGVLIGNPFTVPGPRQDQWPF